MGTTAKFFYKGAQYRVRKSLTAGDTFTAGELLVFKTSAFSWYDGAQAYEFRRLSDGVELTWLLGDDEPLDLREEYFERLAAE